MIPSCMFEKFRSGHTYWTPDRRRIRFISRGSYNIIRQPNNFVRFPMQL
jgi:hypothetical protein